MKGVHIDHIVGRLVDRFVGTWPSSLLIKRFCRKKKVLFPFNRSYALSNVFQLYTYDVWNHILDLQTDITKHLNKGVNKTK